MKNECDVFTVQFTNSSPECKNLLDILQFLEPHRVCYAQLYKAYQIACTIPTTTVENERSFSCMKRVKTFLRSSIADLRLGDLGTLSLNGERTAKIDMEDIIEQFAKYSDIRIVLF